jgi:transposase
MENGGRISLGAAIRLRADYDGDVLRQLAKASRDAKQSRRLLALALVCDGGTRSEAAKLGGGGLQIVRDWVERFNAEGPKGLIDRKASGARPKLTAEQRQALSDLVERGPTPAIHGVVRWRLIDLAQWVWEEFGVSLSESGMSRILKGLGFAKLSARPRHHAQNEHAIEGFEKTSPPCWRRSGSGCRPAPRSSWGGRMKPGSGRKMP